MNYIITKVIVACVFICGTSCFPSKPSRRSAVSSNQFGSSSEVIVHVPLHEEQAMQIDEEEVGNQCSNLSLTSMGLIKLSGRGAAVCNDGSEAGYYLLRQTSSNKWVIYLEGGWYCSDETSCKLRKFTDPQLTSSRYWEYCKSGAGIYSVLQDENPYLYHANMVYIPYCSSDVWSGTARDVTLGDESFNFMGSIIIKQVISMLIQNHGMRDASSVLLTGGSAGGTGVFMNIDRVQQLLNAAGVLASVRGVVDSGWYLKRPEMDRDRHCRFSSGCSAVALIKLGSTLWRPNIPPSCIRAHRSSRARSINSARSSGGIRDQLWKCFFGPVVHRHIEAQVFIVQWIFDLVQLKSDNINLMNIRQSRRELHGYIKGLYEEVKESFDSVKGVFASSCVSHMILDSSEWQSISVSHVSLPDAIQCWEVNLDSTAEMRSNNDFENGLVHPTQHPNSVDAQMQRNHNRGDIYSDNRGDEFGTPGLAGDDVEYGEDGYYQTYLSETPEPLQTIEPAQCKQRVIDLCPLPQCNPTCPSLYNPKTHTTVNPIDFLESLGINLRLMALQKGSNAAQLLRDLSHG